MAQGIFGTILDTTGERLKERFQKEQDFRRMQTQNLLNSIHQLDENGNPVLSPEQMEQAWGEIQRVNNSPGAKDIINKARRIYDMLFKHKAPQAAMQRQGTATGANLAQQPQTAQPQQNQPDVGNANPDVQGGINELPSPPEQTNQVPSAAIPPGQQKQPVQKVAAAATTQPAGQPQGGPTPPPQKTSTAQLIAAGSPQKQQTIMAKVGAEARAQLEEEKQKMIGEYKLEQERTKGQNALDKQREANRATLTKTLEALGESPQFDEKGEYTGSRKLSKEEQAPAVRSRIEKEEAQAGRQTNLSNLDNARAAYYNASARAKEDPESPVNKIMLDRLEFNMDMGRRRLAVSEANLGLRSAQELALDYGIDAKGSPLPGAPINPETNQPVGMRYARWYMPTAMTMGRGQMAAPAISQGMKLIELSRDPSNADIFGYEGALKAWAATGKAGTSDPRILDLIDKVNSFSNFLAAIHGTRGERVAAQFRDTMKNVNSPEAFAKGIESYVDSARDVAEAAKPNAALPKPPGRTSSASEPAPAEGKWRVIR